MKLLLLILMALSLYGSEPSFGKLEGTAVIVDLNTSVKTVYGKDANERMHPCSTFKVLNTMIALDSGAVKDENETLAWDGVVRAYDVWNHDHSMRTALPVSAVWFYQEMARHVGEKKMAQMLKQAEYGNMDSSRSLTDFWLGEGSLLISPNEQVSFLEKLMHDSLPFSSRAMAVVKEIMTLEKREGYILAGKTGTCGDVGWFVGFVEEENVTKIFAFNLKGGSGLEAKKIALDYFKAENE